MRPEIEINSLVAPHSDKISENGKTSQRSVLSDSEKSPLGNNVEIASQPQSDDAGIKWSRQAAARELLPHRPVSKCLRFIVPGQTTVEIRLSAKTRRAFYKNLITCQCVWECPICAVRITERRKRALAEILGAHTNLTFLEADGTLIVRKIPTYNLAMATFTLAHRENEHASTVIKRVQAAYKKMWSGRWAVAFKKDWLVIGTLRAIEITRGGHGWHPHIHLLLISETVIGELSRIAIEITLRQRWQSTVQEIGGNASFEYGCTVETGTEKLAIYVSKLSDWSLAAEMTKYPTKNGRDSKSLFQLLDAYLAGDIQSGENWLEGVGAMRGTQHLRPSPGLWQKLGVPNLDEYELKYDIEAEENSLLAALTVEQWRVVLRHDKRAETLAAARDGEEHLWRFLESIGVSRGE